MNLNDHAFETLATLNRAAAAQRLPERPLSPPDHGSLTDDEINAIQAVVEQRAGDECDEYTEPFRDWLNSKAGRRTRQDYAQFRSAMLSEDEQREILESL